MWLDNTVIPWKAFHTCKTKRDIILLDCRPASGVSGPHSSARPGRYSTGRGTNTTPLSSFVVTSSLHHTPHLTNADVIWDIQFRIRSYNHLQDLKQGERSNTCTCVYIHTLKVLSNLDALWTEVSLLVRCPD